MNDAARFTAAEATDWVRLSGVLPMARHCATIRTRRDHRGESAKSTFAALLRRIWPRDSAKQIAGLSGISQRNVENWLCGLSKPSAEAIRALLRSERGFDFLTELMDGAEASWWRVVQIGVRMAELERRSAETRQALEAMRQDADFNLSQVDGLAGMRVAR